MKRKRLSFSGFRGFFPLAVCLLWMGVSGGSVPGSHAAALEPVHLHGQIRDSGGNPRQGFVMVSVYHGPDLTGGPTTPDGFYAFDVPAYDNYVVTAMPVQRVAVGDGEAPVGFVDRWERIDRTTETDLEQDVIVTPGGSILLDAYDPQGKRLFINTFPQQGIFGTWPLGSPPVTDPIQKESRQRSLIWGWQTISGVEQNPAVLMLPAGGAATYTVWGLWSVPEAGTILLEMDNGGLGYSVAEGEAKAVNIAYELARTQLRKAQEKFDQKAGAGYGFSASIAQWLAQAQAALDSAQVKLGSGDGSGAAISAYQALTPAIRAKEEIVLQAARQDIQKRRAPVTLQVVGADHQPLDDVQIDYQQTDHDFILGGAWPGDGAPLGDTPATRHYVGNPNLYAGIAKQIGFETLSFPPWPAWGLVQRQSPSVPYRFDDDVMLHKMASLGFRGFGGTIWLYNGAAYTYPAYLEGLDYAGVKAAGLEFITTTVGHYKGKIQLYETVNEPNTANDLHFSPAQMLDFTQAMLAAADAADPGALKLVNLSAPGFTHFPGPGEVTGADYSSYHYLQTMLSAGVKPDAVGLQFYNGASLPAIDLGTASDLLDVYGQDFDLPIFISELEYPTHEEYPGLVNKSTLWGWHQGHTDQAQADWAVGMFTLAYSKPYILGANWSLSSDLPADLAEDGRAGDGYLHRDGLTVRPMAYALGDLLHSWVSSGTTQTGPEGQAGFSGFAGNYQVRLTGANGAVQQETIHVREGQANALTIEFDPTQALAENRQDALAGVGRARQTIAWAGNLGKISGVAEARALVSQARSSYDAGRYWEAAALGAQAWDALAMRVDGQAGDWSGVSPMYLQSDAQGQANNSQLRKFYATLDGDSVVMQFEINTTAPQRTFLFELDTGADGTIDYSVTASPRSSGTLFFSSEYVGHPELIFTHLIPSIDVIYGSTVEIRIPLADLGNPKRVGVRLYREDLGDGTMSGLIPNLGVAAAPPWRISIPMTMRK